jgi:hypothetical protein
MERRLVQLRVSWGSFNALRWAEMPQGTQIWAAQWGDPVWTSPYTIAGGWLGQESNRILDPDESRQTSIGFLWDTTGGKTFTLEAEWDDGTGGSRCSTGPIQVVIP